MRETHEQTLSKKLLKSLMTFEQNIFCVKKCLMNYLSRATAAKVLTDALTATAWR